MDNKILGAVSSIKGAALINMVSRCLGAILGLVYTVILARILSPEDFGVVAIAQVFVTFFALFQDMGLGSAIIQRQDLEPIDISRLFGFSMLLSLGLGFMMAIAGIPISFMYEEPILRGICCALSLTTFFSTLNTVPNALLMKSRRFVVVGIRQVVSTLVASIFGITSAHFGAGPYAIAVYSISNSLFTFSWNYATNRVRPVFTNTIASVRKVFGYSAWLFGFNLINYFSRNTDNLLVGYYFGSAQLGNYSKAYQLMQRPQSYLTSVIASVLHPMLAERQDDTDYIYEVFIKLCKALSLIGVFIAVLCFFSADEIVDILYGSQWQSSAACLRCLSLSIWSQMVCGSSGPIFQVLNRTKEQFVRGLLISVATVGATLVGVAMGSIESVALLVGIAYFVPFILLLPFLIQRSFSRSAGGFLKVFLPDLVIAILLGLVLFAIDWLPSLGMVASLLAKLVVATIVYFILIRTFGQEKWLYILLPSKLRKRLTSKASS